MDTVATAGIVIIGDEILSGQFADENSPFLIGELRTLGVALMRIAVIPDAPAEIAATVRDFSESFDYVFTSGGVGPTHDDVTMAAIASAFGADLIRHPDLIALLERHIGPEMLPAHLRLAEVPRGAQLVYGPESRAPVVQFQNIFILPGVPALFRKKFLSIAEQFRAHPFTSAALYCAADEAHLAPVLSRAVELHPEVAFGSYPRVDETEFKVLITIKGKDRDAVARAFDDLAGRLGDQVVRVDRPS